MERLDRDLSGTCGSSSGLKRRLEAADMFFETDDHGDGRDGTVERSDGTLCSFRNGMTVRFFSFRVFFGKRPIDSSSKSRLILLWQQMSFG